MLSRGKLYGLTHSLLCQYWNSTYLKRARPRHTIFNAWEYRKMCNFQSCLFIGLTTISNEIFGIWNSLDKNFQRQPPSIHRLRKTPSYYTRNIQFYIHPTVYSAPTGSAQINIVSAETVSGIIVFWRRLIRGRLTAWLLLVCLLLESRTKSKVVAEFRCFSSVKCVRDVVVDHVIRVFVCLKLCQII